MTQPRTAPSRWSTAFKSAVLFLAVSGFTLELLAIALESWPLFKVGLSLFLLGLPCYLLGLSAWRLR